MYIGTVLRVLGLLFVIHTRDHEPPHVTIYKGTPDNYEAVARIEIATSRVISSNGFRSRLLKILEGIVKSQTRYLMEKWNESRPK